MSEFRGFIVASQFGGPHTGVDDEIPLLKSIIESHMPHTHAQGIDSVQMAFRVDGQFAAYRCAKAEKLKLMKSRREAWVDLGVPTSAWENRTRAEVRLYLCDCVEAALELLVARFKKDGLCQDCETVYRAWTQAKEEYLQSP